MEETLASPSLLKTLILLINLVIGSLLISFGCPERCHPHTHPRTMQFIIVSFVRTRGRDVPVCVNECVRRTLDVLLLGDLKWLSWESLEVLVRENIGC